MQLSTEQAIDVMTHFTANARAVLVNPTAATPKQAYGTLGHAWAQALRAIQKERSNIEEKKRVYDLRRALPWKNVKDKDKVA